MSMADGEYRTTSSCILPCAMYTEENLGWAWSNDLTKTTFSSLLYE